MKFRSLHYPWIVIPIFIATTLMAEEPYKNTANSIIRCSYASAELDKMEQQAHRQALLSFSPECSVNREDLAKKVIDTGLFDETAHRSQNTHCNSLEKLDAEFEPTDFHYLVELLKGVDARQTVSTSDQSQAGMLGTNLLRFDSVAGSNCSMVGAVEIHTLPTNSASTVLTTWKANIFYLALAHILTGYKPIREPIQNFIDTAAGISYLSPLNREYVSTDNKTMSLVSETQAYSSLFCLVARFSAPVIIAGVKARMHKKTN